MLNDLATLLGFDTELVYLLSLSQKSFNRQIPYDWSHYNTLMLRLRGDGRPYMVVLQMDREYDLMWFDQYHYPLWTRGGPYWQETFVSCFLVFVK